MADVAIKILGDPASYNAALGSASASTVRFGDAYKAAFAEMDDATLALAVSQDKLAISTVKFGVGTTGAARATMAYRRELDAMQASQLAAVGSIGRGLTVGVTLPLVGVAYEATKMALSFDQSMTLIRTQAGASSAEVARMSTGVLELVKSGQSYTQSANSMAQGLFFIESEGMRGAKALDILKVAAAGAATGQASMADTTNALTSAIHVYGETSTGAAGVMATLNAAIGQGKLHMDDLDAALGTKLLPTAKALGISLPQILAAIDTFTKSGPGAASSATNIAQALLKMEHTTPAGAKALADMGIGANQLANELKSGGLPEALGTVAAAYNKLKGEGQTVEANQDIFSAFGGAKGGAAALLMVQQYAGYIKTLGAVQKGSSPATFWASVAVEMKQPDAQIHESLVKMGADMIGLGQKIAPMVAQVTGGLGDIVGWIDKLPGPAKDATEIFLGLLGAAGPIMWGGTKAVEMFKTMSTGVRAVGSAAQWMAAKFTGSAATSDTALGTVDASAAKTELAVAAVGEQMTITGTEAGVMAVKTDAALATMDVAAAGTETAVAGIGVAASLALGPVLLLAAGMYEVATHAQAISQFFGGAKSASSLSPAQIAKAIAGGMTQAQLDQLKSIGLSPATYAAGEADLKAATLGPAKPTTAAANAQSMAAISGTGSLTFADVMPAISRGLLSIQGLQALQKRFVSSSDYQAAVALLDKTTYTGPGGGPVAGAHGAAPTPVGALTLTQRLMMNPADPVALAEQDKLDSARLAKLARERSAGVLGNPAYVAQAAPIQAQLTANQSTLRDVPGAGGAATTAQSAAAVAAATQADQLKTKLASVTPASSTDRPETAAQIAATDALVGFYKTEATNTKLTEEQRRVYAGLAVAAIAKAGTDAATDLNNYQTTTIDVLKANVAKAESVKGTIAQTIATEAALAALEAGYRKQAHDAPTAEERATAASNEYATAGKLNTMRDNYTTPAALSLASAKAQAQAPGLGAENDMAEVNAYKKIKSAAEAALKSGTLAIQGQIAAWNTIAEANSDITSALGTGAIGQVRQASAETITAGLKMSAATKAALDQRLAQLNAHGGHTANYVGIQGIAVGPSAAGGPLTPAAPPIHTHVYIDGREVATVVSTRQTKASRYRSVQTRGVHAGL